MKGFYFDDGDIYNMLSYQVFTLDGYMNHEHVTS
ncbi:UNVERIFIED_ORG: hypothetical protein M2355_001835 [Lelliottia amnigena]|nr:hypothetical protein [Lelliottia amnigena]